MASKDHDSRDFDAREDGFDEEELFELGDDAQEERAPATDPESEAHDGFEDEEFFLLDEDELEFESSSAPVGAESTPSADELADEFLEGIDDADGQEYVAAAESEDIDFALENEDEFGEPTPLANDDDLFQLESHAGEAGSADEAMPLPEGSEADSEFGGQGTMPEVEEVLFGEQTPDDDAAIEEFSAAGDAQPFEIDGGPAFSEEGSGWEGEEGFQPEALGLESSDDWQEPRDGGEAPAGLDQWDESRIFRRPDSVEESPGDEEFTLVGDEMGSTDPSDLQLGELGEEHEFAGADEDFGGAVEFAGDDSDGAAEVLDELGQFGEAAPELSDLQPDESEGYYEDEAEPEFAVDSVPDPDQFAYADEGAEEEFDDDPIYGKPMSEVGSLTGAGYGEEEASDSQAWKESEELFVDGGDPSRMPGAEPVVLGARRGRWSRRFMAAGMAASVLVLGTVGFVMARPDLPFSVRIREGLGLEPPKTEEIRVSQVERPRIDTGYPLLSVQEQVAARQGTKPEPGPETPESGTESPGDLVAKNPRLQMLRVGALVAAKIFENARKQLADEAGPETGEKVAVGPEQPELPQPELPQPEQPELPQPENPQPELPQPEQPENPQPEIPEIPEVPGPEQPAGPPSIPVAVAGGGEERPAQPEIEPSQPQEVPGEIAAPKLRREFDLGILRGTQAIAQLRNGNFFVGRVAKISAMEVTLSVKQGELTFYPNQVNTLTPISESIAKRIENSPEGWVKLRNSEKIRGRIVENSAELLTIQKGSAKIVIPRKSILEVREKADPKYRLAPEETDWLEEDDLPEMEKADEIALPQVEETIPKGGIRVKIDTGKGTPAAPKK